MPKSLNPSIVLTYNESNSKSFLDALVDPDIIDFHQKFIHNILTRMIKIVVGEPTKSIFSLIVIGTPYMHYQLSTQRRFSSTFTASGLTDVPEQFRGLKPL